MGPGMPCLRHASYWGQGWGWTRGWSFTKHVPGITGSHPTSTPPGRYSSTHVLVRPEPQQAGSRPLAEPLFPGALPGALAIVGPPHTCHPPAPLFTPHPGPSRAHPFPSSWWDTEALQAGTALPSQGPEPSGPCSALGPGLGWLRPSWARTAWRDHHCEP